MINDYKPIPPHCLLKPRRDKSKTLVFDLDETLIKAVPANDENQVGTQIKDGKWKKVEVHFS